MSTLFTAASEVAQSLGIPATPPGGAVAYALASVRGNRFYSVDETTGALINRTGFAPPKTVVTIPYSTTITPQMVEFVNVGILTGNITIANPTGPFTDGQRTDFRFVQDGTGSRTLTFGNLFKVPSGKASAIPTTAGAKFEVLFQYCAADAIWRCMAVSDDFNV